MEPITENRPTQDGGTKIAILGLAGLYFLVCLCIGIFIFPFRQQIPGIQNYSPTATPTLTATPIAHWPASGDKIIEDDFADNNLQWQSVWDNDNVSVRGGKLYLSAAPGEFAMAECLLCPSLRSNYYVQADLATDQAIDESYGIVFSASAYHSDYYLFEINSTRGIYALYKYRGDDWTRRMGRKSDLIKSYPDINTLGVSIDNDVIALYINGQMVDTYQDTLSVIASGTFSIYVNSSSFTLIVDNLFAYGK
jgi:hypothetical protein